VLRPQLQRSMVNLTHPYIYTPTHSWHTPVPPRAKSPYLKAVICHLAILVDRWLPQRHRLNSPLSLTGKLSEKVGRLYKKKGVLGSRRRSAQFYRLWTAWLAACYIKMRICKGCWLRAFYFPRAKFWDRNGRSVMQMKPSWVKAGRANLAMAP
jgi:hypothetical protein